MIFDGTFLFIWERNAIHGGNINAIVEEGKQLGITGPMIKFANGNLVNDPVSQGFMDNFKQLAPAFKAAGLTVGGWIYQYLTDPAGEVDACVQAVAAGADFLVLDAEADIANKVDSIREFGRLLRQKLPNIPVAFSGYAIPGYHPEIPFAAYAEFVDAFMPQVYWADMGWAVDAAFQTSIDSYKKFGKPIYPTGQSYDKATVSDMTKFVLLCNNAGITGISWWDWQHATPEQLLAIKNNLIAAPVKQEQQKPPDSTFAGVSSWALQSVQKAVQAGAIKGDENGIKPQEPVTREMLCLILDRCGILDEVIRIKG